MLVLKYQQQTKEQEQQSTGSDKRDDSLTGYHQLSSLHMEAYRDTAVQVQESVWNHCQLP